jgi:hypothetical protein
MTQDVVFLTSGRAPMRRDEFAAGFRAIMEIATIKCRSNVQALLLVLLPSIQTTINPKNLSS